MNSLTLIIIAPLFAGLVVWLLTHWPKVAAGVGAMASVGMWLLLRTMIIPDTAVSPTTQFLSQALLINDDLRDILLFVYMGLTVLFLLAIPFAQNRSFVPGSLAVMGLLTAGLLIRPFSVGILLIWIALAFVAVIIQGNRAGVTRGGVTFLVLSSVAMPLLLLAVWAVETQPINLVTPITRFALLGVIILLAGFPFHIWVTAVVHEAKPLLHAFLFGLVQLILVAFIFNFLDSAPWLQADVQFQEMVRLSGIATLLTVSLLAMTAVHFSRLIDSLILLDMSLVLLMVLVPNGVGMETAVQLQYGRFITLLLISIGTILRQQTNSTEEISPTGLPENATITNQGIARRAPLSMALFIFGAMSLIGLPFTFGFSGHWAAIQALGTNLTINGDSNILLITILFATGFCAFALFRAILYWFAQPES